MIWDSVFSTHWTSLVSMVPLGICSVLILAIILERLLNFRPRKLFNRTLADQFITHLSKNENDLALESVKKEASLQQKVYFTGLKDFLGHKVLPEIAFMEHSLSKLDELAKWVSTLRFVAKIAPLLGLLGTVLGMIEAFSSIAASANDGTTNINLVASGIGTALITTAAGLMVAIPALTVASILSKIGEKVYQDFEDSLKTITITCGGMQAKDGTQNVL